jgi:hypothetical protein
LAAVGRDLDRLDATHDLARDERLAHRDRLRHLDRLLERDRLGARLGVAGLPSSR